MKPWVTKFVFGLGLLVALFFVCLAYSYFIEPNRLVVNKTTLKIKDWKPAFEGYKIVVLSDIHGGSNGVTPARLREIVAKTNEQDADIVVLLGDYVSERPDDSLRMPVHEVADGLAGITAKNGVYAVLGNHDGWFGDEIVAREFDRVGYRMMQNEVVTITRNGSNLRILGLKDIMRVTNGWQEFSKDAKRALSLGDQTGDIIALDHNPDMLPIITGKQLISPDLKLMLAGHTHGGQVWLPVFGTPIVPSSYGQKYSYGHVRENDVDMFVTSGIGTSILPFRFMMPPEIAVLTIVRGD